MTSPPSPSSLRALASAKPSSAPGEAARSEAAVALSQLQTHIPAIVSPWDTTFAPPSSLDYGSPHHAGVEYPPTPFNTPAPRPYELRSQKPREPPTSNVSVKRPLSSSELRSPKLPRGSQDTEWSNNPAEVTVAPRGQSSSRASAPSSTAYDRFIQGYEPRLPSVKRQVGRPRRSPLPPNATQSPLSPRRDEAGDHAMGPPPLPLGIGVSAISPPSPVFRDPSGTSSATSPRSNAQDNMAMVAYRPAAAPVSPYEPRSAGPYRETADKPPRFLYPKTADFSPRLSGSRIADYSMSPSGVPFFDPHPPSSRVPIDIPSNASSPTDPRGTSPRLPAGPPPSPSHEGLSRRLPVPDALNIGSAALDGYKILRNAVPAALVRDLVFVMEKGLPITAHSDTHEAYSTPFHGYLLRDEFNAVSLPFSCVPVRG